MAISAFYFTSIGHSIANSTSKKFKSYLEKISRLILFSSNKSELKLQLSYESTEEDHFTSETYANTEVCDSNISLPTTIVPSGSSFSGLESPSLVVEIVEKKIERPYITIDSHSDSSVSSIRFKFNSEGRKILTRRRFSSDGSDDFSDLTPPSPTHKIKHSYGVGNDSISNFQIHPAQREFEPIISSFEVIPQPYLFSNTINSHFRPIDVKRKL